ncbi:MAG: AsmA family protein, partial [Pseudomonadota bacterium]|nr:AsmA family protein [Pseudomonadota bacterium]
MTDLETTPEAHRAWIARHPWGTAFGLLALAVIILILLWDWNWFKGPIERRVTANTGREFHIDGNLDVDLGRTLKITADGLRFGNTGWAREQEMASTDRLEFDLRFWPLLRGRVEIPRISLDKPALHLQRDSKGENNWTLKDGGDSDLPEFRNVHINSGVMTFFEPAKKTDIKVSVDSGERRKQDAEPPILVDGGGQWNGNTFSIKGTAESPLELRDSERPYRIDMRAVAGSTKAHARGALLDPLRFRDMDLALALSGRNMA